MDKELNPDSVEMTYEPARTIGQTFANKVMMRPYVAALFGIIAQMFSFTTDDAMIDNVTLLITLGSMGYAAWEANREARKRAYDQAEKTRNAVYSPATVAEIQDEAYKEGLPPTEMKSPLPEPPGAGILDEV